MLRVVYMGAPDFAVPALSEIVGAGYDVAAVYTQPPRPAGRRGLELRQTPVHVHAEALGLPVETPLSLKDADAQATLVTYAPDVVVVVAYGLLLPQAVLDVPEHGCLNFHPSDLPRWRGAAPLQRTVMAGDTATAACVMRMEAGLDTGPVCLREPMPVPGDMTAGQLHDAMAARGGDMLVRALGALARGSLNCEVQSEAGVTYANKIDKAEARIDWSQSGVDVHNLVRGLTPFPGAWFELTQGDKTERVKVLRATVLPDAADGTNLGNGTAGTALPDHQAVLCGDGTALQLLEVQRAGKKPVSGADFFHGARLATGQPLHS